MRIKALIVAGIVAGVVFTGASLAGGIVWGGDAHAVAAGGIVWGT